MAGNAEELVIKVIGDDAQYTAVMKRVQRTIEKASGSTKKFNRSSRELGEGAGNVRRQFGLLDNAIRGAHSYAMIDLIRGFEKTKLVMVALPIAATVAGIAVIGGVVGEAVQKFEEWRQKSKEVANAMTTFTTSMRDGSNHLKEQLLQVQAQVDKLNGHPLKAMHDELDLINMQSMDTLIGNLKQVGTELDTILKKEQTSMFLPGIGSKGAQNAWSDFALHYHELLSQQNAKGASDLLAGTLKQAETVLKLQQDAQKAAATHKGNPAGDSAYGAMGANIALRAPGSAYNILQSKYGIGDTDAEVTSQQNLIRALKAQQGAESTVRALASGKITLATAKYAPTSKLLGSLGQGKIARELAARQGKELTGANSDAEARERMSRTAADMRNDAYEAFRIRSGVSITPGQNRIAEASLQLQVMTGRISRLDAAQQAARLHAKEYADTLADLKARLKAIDSDTTLTPRQRAAAISRVQNEINRANTQHTIDQRQDAHAVYGSTVSGATRTALSQMVQSWTDMSQQIPNLITSSLDEVNRSLASSLMAHTATGQEYRRGIENALGSTARGIGTHLLNAGFQNIEGSALKKLFGGKPDGTASNPIYTKSVDGIGKAGSMIGKNLSSMLGSIGHGFGKVGGWFGSLLGMIPHFAGGGDFLANHSMLVGEQGPEIVSFGSPGHVTPNRSIFNGDTNHLYIDARGSSDPASVHAAVMRAMGAYMPMMPGVAVHSIKNENSRVPSRKRI